MPQLKCPYCLNDDITLMEQLGKHEWYRDTYLCSVCSKVFEVKIDTIRKGKDSSQDTKDENKGHDN